MYKDITTREIINTLKCTHKWKSPGKDKMTNFWLNNLFSADQLMKKLISEITKELEQKPVWLTEEITYLQPKTKDTTNKKKQLLTNHMLSHNS